MKEIIIPTINNNDTDAILVLWVKRDGEFVRTGEVVAVLETTKATYDLEADADGVLATVANQGARYVYGTVIGRLFPGIAEREAYVAQAPRVVKPTEVVMTAAAKKLAEQHGITDAQVRSLGKQVLKENDIMKLLDHGKVDSIEPTPQQRTIARTVVLSRSTIPDAFLLQKVYVTTAMVGLAEYSKQRSTMVGLAELLVCAVARLAGAFPIFFGQLDDQLRFIPSKAGNIGVTLDLGRGLFIPVLRDAATLSLEAVAARLAGFRMKALRNAFDAADLTGGDLSISLNTDTDIVFVQPIVLPTQTCMISLGAVLKEVVLGEDGQLAERRFVHIGVAYDHRVINGAVAGAFAQALKKRLEAPDAVTSLGGTS